MTMDEWNAKSAGAVMEAKPEDIRVISEEKNDPVKEPEVKKSVETTENNAEEKIVLPSESSAALSLILGIFSILFGVFFGGAPWIGILLGVGGIIIGASEKKKKHKATKGLATGGFVCGIVGTSLSVVVGIVCAALGIFLKIAGSFLSFLF